MKPSATPQEPSAHGPTGNLGLGLYVAGRIVHAHHGRIEVESSEAQGTTFTVHLPRGDQGGRDELNQSSSERRTASSSGGVTTATTVEGKSEGLRVTR